MTLEQAAVVIAGYLITYIITSVKNGRLLTFNKQETNKNVDKNDEPRLNLNITNQIN